MILNVSKLFMNDTTTMIQPQYNKILYHEM